MNGNTESRITHRIPDEILHLVSYETARRHSLVPLELRGEKLLVAMVNPGNLAALDDIRLRSGYEIETVKVSPAELAALLQKNFHDPSDHPVCPALAGPAASRVPRRTPSGGCRRPSAASRSGEARS